MDAATLRGHQAVKEHVALQPVMSVEYTLLRAIRLRQHKLYLFVLCSWLARRTCLYSAKKPSSTNLLGTGCTADASGVCRSQ